MVDMEWMFIEVVEVRVCSVVLILGKFCPKGTLGTIIFGFPNGRWSTLGVLCQECY